MSFFEKSGNRFIVDVIASFDSFLPHKIARTSDVNLGNTGASLSQQVHGLIASLAGFGILRFLLYIKEEILLVLATSSSETALPTLMAKLEKLGCSKSLVGLVVPTGYTFNTDGTSIYMTLAALFVAQATNTHLQLEQQLVIFGVAILTSKGASGVQGAEIGRAHV